MNETEILKQRVFFLNERRFTCEAPSAILFSSSLFYLCVIVFLIYLCLLINVETRKNQSGSKGMFER